MKLHIVSPDIREGDAVGNHCIFLAQALRGSGIETALYARRHNASAEPVLPLESLLGNCQADDLLLLSFSTFQPQLPALLSLPCRKIVYFHGITPVSLLLEHDPTSAYWSSKALLQLPSLAKCQLFIANSSWNLDDLLKHFEQQPSLERLAVVPPITPYLPLFLQPAREQPANSPFEVIVVGRVAPHKKIESAIEMIGQLNTNGFDARLRIIGPSNSEVYQTFLDATVDRLQLRDRVGFEGMLSQTDLISAFQRANALMVTSEHEGFCIPVLEALHLGLPAIVRVGTAASEVGGNAVAKFETITEGAEALQRLMQEPGLRNAMVKSGVDRAKSLVAHASVVVWKKHIRNTLNDGQA